MELTRGLSVSLDGSFFEVHPIWVVTLLKDAKCAKRHPVCVFDKCPLLVFPALVVHRTLVPLSLHLLGTPYF